jgi:DNA-binding transcriptional LysR family regulator
MTNPLTPEAIRLLRAIVDQGSMAAAARMLGLVPSALTYRVRQLEDALDVLLFDRSRREARLTAAGSVLLHEGEHALATLDAIAQRVRRVGAGWEPELALAVDSIVDRGVIYELIAAFDGEGAPTRLTVRDEALSGTCERLLRGEADLAIGIVAELPAAEATIELASAPLGTVEFVFAVAPHHPLAPVERPLTDADIAPYRIVAVADSTRERDGYTVGILPGQDVLTVGTLFAKREIQLRGLACGYLPYCLAAPYLETGRLVAKATVKPARTSQFAYAWHPRANLGRALSWWLARLNIPNTRKALLYGSRDPAGATHTT